MTGYAVATSEGAAGTLTIEIKSVNSRFLDLQFRINDELRALEPDLRSAIMAAITRGKVEVRLSFGRKASGGSQALNQELLNDLARLQAEVTRHFASASQMSVAELLRWPGVIEESTIGQESLQADVAALTKTTIEAFVESRKREGAALEAMLQSRIDSMEAIVKRITPLIPQVIAQFQQKAIERMQDALGLAGHGNGTTLTRQEVLERIRQEVTLYGIRIDVSEELSRLSAHLNETRHILKKGGQVGKRLDFMMQELNREANTLGAKASVKELADASMELKLLIEQMREQVQNLE
ncbi:MULTISPECIES: YicC/YloC family endoribonuclease [unclassified Massilia]|uniref:YicC/YloC family endoribonuclease n=1 Tax=unclassified Massilia TaxID=2609279 RepID=UPI001B833CD1|nr:MULTISPECIES: YicC/YloC family endoribonuclease [unclassified Massilia]MBQ5940289.1 YicC family protein [Massilia sp. AB1]MBQ5962713.1 YicC family protein [Massilia sp. ZL223]